MAGGITPENAVEVAEVAFRNSSKWLAERHAAVRAALDAREAEARALRERAAMHEYASAAVADAVRLRVALQAIAIATDLERAQRLALDALSSRNTPENRANR